MSAKFLGPFVSYEGYDPSETSFFETYHTYANFSNVMEIYQADATATEVTMYRHRFLGLPPDNATNCEFEFYLTDPEGGDQFVDSDYGFTKFLNRNVSNVLTSSPEQVIIKPEYPKSLATVSQQTSCNPFQ